MRRALYVNSGLAPTRYSKRLKLLKTTLVLIQPEDTKPVSSG